jgi:hypothetical protein
MELVDSRIEASDLWACTSVLDTRGLPLTGKLERLYI